MHELVTIDTDFINARFNYETVRSAQRGMSCPQRVAQMGESRHIRVRKISGGKYKKREKYFTN
jgi:hypothetical protein